MAIIPKQASYTPKQENDEIPNPLRPYLGMSEAGHSCTRYLWYSFRWAYTRVITRRQARIFEKGEIEESRVIRDLVEWGYQLPSMQATYTAAWGHMKGHSDGTVIIDDKLLLLEVKSMAAKYYADFIKHGLKKSKPLYYDQGVLYLNAEKLDTALFVVCNKDTEERKYTTIQADPARAEFLLDRGQEIIIAEEPPDKIGNNPSWFECKMCPAIDICHYNAPYNKSCRLCQHVEIHHEGIWHCTKHQKDLSVNEQQAACSEFTQIPV